MYKKSEMEIISSKSQAVEHSVNSPEWHFKQILKALNENVDREGLKDTPKRYIKFLKEFLKPQEFNFTTFDAEQTDEMIIQTNIPFYSLCEHHIAPFFGVGHIAYVPNKKIVAEQFPSLISSCSLLSAKSRLTFSMS